MPKPNQPPPSLEIIKQVRRDHGPKTLVGFSGGKDSICATLAIKPHFDEMIPFFLYLVPDLEFVDEHLHQCEKDLFGGAHITRMPHPGFYGWLRSGIFQPPHRWPLIQAAQLPEFEYKDIHAILRQKFDADGAYNATGVMAAGSPMRRMSITQHGAILKSKKEYFPVWDYKQADILGALNKAKISLPIDYRIFGRSFDGLDARFILPIKRHFPRDYAQILEWFPLIEAEVFRAERMQ